VSDHLWGIGVSDAVAVGQARVRRPPEPLVGEHGGGDKAARLDAAAIKELLAAGG
jgi:hypothetical protein